MKKYAVIRVDTGECLQIQRLTMIDDSVLNSTTDGLLYKEVTNNQDLLDTSEMEFRDLHYWKDDEWKTRESRPSPYHFWQDYTWVQNLEPLFITVRQNRDARLMASDWTQVADVQLSDEAKAAWLEYRQQLRDLPETYKDATVWDDIKWPTKPMFN